jgi:electron transfer flavoprotein alpha subunit
VNRPSANNPTGPVVVVAEHRDCKLSPLTNELSVCARRIADWLGLEVRVVVLGENVEALAQEVAHITGQQTIAIQVPGLVYFHGEAYVKILASLLAEWDAAVVVGGHTTSGMDWAPALAVDLNAAYLPGIEALEEDAEGLLFSRAGLFGKVREVIKPAAFPFVVTVAPGAFPAPSGVAASPGQVDLLKIDTPFCRSRVQSDEKAAGQDAGLAQAQVVVAAGRGIGKPDNLELIRELAGLFSGSAVAGSRPVCDQGWLNYGNQVGLTGATVSPKLYISCGISGARQHTVGMQGSGFIVAISTDPAAAIFNVADVCIVEDLTAFIPALLEQAQGLNQSPGR